MRIAIVLGEQVNKALLEYNQAHVILRRPKKQLLRMDRQDWEKKELFGSVI